MASIAIDQANAYSLMSKVQETGVPDLDTGEFRLALFGDSFVFNQTHAQWSEIKANEISEVGYTADGKVIVFNTDGRYSYNASTGIWTFGPNCDPLDWAAADFTLDPVKWGVVYEYIDDDGSADDTSPLVGALRLESLAAPDDETFRWNFPAAGIVRMSAQFVAPE